MPVANREGVRSVTQQFALLGFRSPPLHLGQHPIGNRARIIAAHGVDDWIEVVEQLGVVNWSRRFEGFRTFRRQDDLRP